MSAPWWGFSRPLGAEPPQQTTATTRRQQRGSVKGRGGDRSGEGEGRGPDSGLVFLRLPRPTRRAQVRVAVPEAAWVLVGFPI